MKFRTITLEDRAEVERCVELSGTQACDAAFVNSYIWKEIYPSLVCFDGSFMYKKIERDGKTVYKYPIGKGDDALALAKLAEDAGGRPVFSGLTADQCEKLQKYLPRLDYAFEEQREYADYIYRTESLISLSGKKLHSKKNFVNRFKASYEGRYEFETITPAHSGELLAFHRYWCEKTGCEDGLRIEACAVKTALRNIEALGLTGIVLRIDGKTAAFSIASRINSSTADVNIEKADTDFDGIYQMINRLTAKHCLSEYEFINREEDMGIPGLRRAKESYRPEILLMRYKSL